MSIRIVAFYMNLKVSDGEETKEYLTSGNPFRFLIYVSGVLYFSGTEMQCHSDLIPWPASLAENRVS